MKLRRNALWAVAGFTVALFAYLAMTTAVTAGMNVFQKSGSLRPLPRVFQPAYGLSQNTVMTAVGGAFMTPILLVGVLAAARVRPWAGLVVGIGIGWALTAGLCAVGFCFWELIFMLPVWWVVGGLMGGVLSGLRRHYHV